MLAAILLAAHLMNAASVIMSPPPVATTPQVVQEDATNNEMNVFIPSGVVNPFADGLFQYGPVTFHPHPSYSFLYGSGVQSSVNNQQNTIVQEFSPGVTVDLGRHWSVDYTPTFNFYSSKAFHDGVDHSASLTGATQYENWNFGLSQDFSLTSDPITETGTQTDQQSYSTALSGGYAFNDKWLANFAVDQNLLLVSQLQNSYNWATTEGVSYQFWPRLNVGVTLGGGYTKVTSNSNVTSNSVSGGSNPDSVNEQLQLTASWRATDKISFQVSAGGEDVQYVSHGTNSYSDSLEPIFSAAIQYQPFKVTQISLSASRTVSASDYFIAAQSSEVTTIGLTLNQRILTKYNLVLGVAYGKTDYTTTFSGTIPATPGTPASPGNPGTSGTPERHFSVGTFRSDDEYSFNASFGRDFLKHGKWAVTYQYSDNESSQQGFSQRSNQIGVQVSFNY